jgi:influenza virus NS1A-binding protein
LLLLPTLCAAAAKRLYAIGGSNLASVEAFDGRAWQNVAPLTQNRTSLAAAAFSGYAYAFGGVLPSGLYLASAERFDGQTWSAVPGAMSVPRAQAVAAVLGKHVYVMGGFHTLPNGDIVVLASVERLGSDGTWESVADMKRARRGAGVALFRNYLYVCGGDDQDLSSVERFDGAKWEESGHLSQGAYGLGAATFNNVLYAAGGQFVNTVQAFDGALWRLVRPMNYIRVSPGLAVFDGKMCAVGGAGSVGDGDLRSGECFDGRGWTDIPSMLHARYGLGLVVF